MGVAVVARAENEHVFGVAELGEPADLPAAALSAEVVELAAEIERLQARFVATVAVWDAKRAWAEDGAVDPRAWLAHRSAMTQRDAHEVMRAARLVQRHEPTAKALADGTITTGHVDVLARAAVGREALYGEHEDQLLAAAAMLPPREFVVAARRWQALADQTVASRDASAAYERRHLHAARTYGGMVAVNGGRRRRHCRRVASHRPLAHPLRVR